MFKESVILLCIVTSAWTQSCIPPPVGGVTSGSVIFTAAAQWAGTQYIANSAGRICASIPGGALSIRSSNGLYECRLYSTSNCNTTHPYSYYADVEGWRNTAMAVMGVTCPWWCNSADGRAEEAPAEN